MKIGLRKKKLIWAGVIGACIALVLAGIGGYFFYTKAQERELALKAQYSAELELLNETVKQNEKGYALKDDVQRGDIITEGMLEEVTLSAAAKSIDGIEAIHVNTVKYFARTDLKANTVLVESMVDAEVPVGNDIREGEYAFIELPTKLKKQDYVDVRIQFPNGDDYVLLSKKKVKDTGGVSLWVDMDEGEILTMSSAIVDAFIEDAKIYAMPYVDGSMQLASQMTYPVKKNVQELIKDSPNIINIAKLNLDKQNRQRLEAGLLEMEADQGEAIRQKEQAVKNIKTQEDKQRELIELNESAVYENEEIVNSSIGQGSGE